MEHTEPTTSTGAAGRRLHDFVFTGWFLAVLTAALADSAASALARAYRARRRQDTSR